MSAAVGSSRLTPKNILTKAAFGFAVSVLVSPAILVFLWMLSLSLKNELDNTAYPPVFIPDPPTLANYVQVFSENVDGPVFPQQLDPRLGLRDAAGARWSACRPATASRGCRRRARSVLILIARMTPALSFLIPLFTAVPVPRPRQHADGAGDHASRHHRADRRVRDGRLFRDAAARAGGGRADRRRQRCGDASATSRCRWRGPASSSRRSSRSSSRGTTSCSARCWPAAPTRTLPAAVYNVLTFEQLCVGPARRRGDRRHAAGAAAHRHGAAPDRRRPLRRRPEGRMMTPQGRGPSRRCNQHVSDRRLSGRRDRNQETSRAVISNASASRSRSRRRSALTPGSISAASPAMPPGCWTTAPAASRSAAPRARARPSA